MPSKPKPPAPPTPATTQRAPAGKPIAPPTADRRWQRTVRYGWDQGGSRGGRK